MDRLLSFYWKKNKIRNSLVKQLKRGTMRGCEYWWREEVYNHIRITSVMGERIDQSFCFKHDAALQQGYSGLQTQRSVSYIFNVTNYLFFISICYEAVSQDICSLVAKEGLASCWWLRIRPSDRKMKFLYLCVQE